MTSQINKIPTWFWIIAIISLLWNLMGVNSFIEMTFPTEESLSKYDEAMQNHILTQYDTWTYIAFAIAVSGGILGSIALLIKKKIAKTIFILSMLGILPQMTNYIFFTNALEFMEVAQVITMPILVILFGAFLIWFSDFCIKKGWLN